MIMSTSYFIIFKCLAATSPSPPLFPGPTKTPILAYYLHLVNCLAICAIAKPANSISVQDAKPYFSIRVLSKRVFIYRVPKVIFFIFKIFLQIEMSLGIHYKILSSRLFNIVAYFYNKVRKISDHPNMFIEFDKYGLNSLRKGRCQGLQSDIDQTYTAFTNHMLDQQQISMNQFCRIAELSQYKYLIYCRSEDQEEQQFVQVVYQILIEKYSSSNSNSKQIFSMYALYYFYCQLQRKRKINVNLQFLDTFTLFLQKHRLKGEKDFMMISKKIFEQCLMIGIKVGPKSLLIKPNGQPARKSLFYKLQNVKKNSTKESNNKSDNPISTKEFVNDMKSEIFHLQKQLESYQQFKYKFNKELQGEHNKLQYSDKNISMRLQKLINGYEKISLIQEKFNIKSGKLQQEQNFQESD